MPEPRSIARKRQRTLRAVSEFVRQRGLGGADHPADLADALAHHAGLLANRHAGTLATEAADMHCSTLHEAARLGRKAKLRG